MICFPKSIIPLIPASYPRPPFFFFFSYIHTRLSSDRLLESIANMSSLPQIRIRYRRPNPRQRHILLELNCRRYHLHLRHCSSLRLTACWQTIRPIWRQVAFIRRFHCVCPVVGMSALCHGKHNQGQGGALCDFDAAGHHHAYVRQHTALS